MRFARPLTLLLALGFMLFGARASHAGPCDAAKNGKFKVKIDSAPQGAAIYVNTKDCPAVGVTPWDGALNPGDYTIIIEAPGYEPASKPFKIARLRKTQELFVPMVKKQDPPKIAVLADADKNMFGASISVDGQPVGQVPMTVTTTAGRHLVQIKKDGFEQFEQWVDAQPNNTFTLAPQLKEIAKPKYGTVVVEADVKDGEIYIDGNKHPDTTPAVINNVIEGVHVIVVKKAPSPDFKATIQVVANQTVKVRAELEGGMVGGVGVVRVLSDAPGARAFLDGTDMGPVPVDVKDVKAGDHIVQVKAPGFQTGEKRVSVASGGSQIVKFDLNAEASGDQGLLKVVSSVPGAEVFIDGAAVGHVPQEKKLAAGEHPVTVRLEGYKEFNQKVRVEGGQTITVQADLKAVGRLRIMSATPNAHVMINGMPAGKTPLVTEVETGETVVRIEANGFQPFEQTMNIEGGKTQTISRELAVAGPSEGELVAEQRSLSSFGARVLPRGRSTVDISAGYPYYFAGRVNVGAGRIAGLFPFDAGVAIRTMFARTELGIGARMTFADPEPFSAGAFTDFYYGSKLLDDSKRNGVTWDLGVAASLTALEHVTISGRLYLDIWSDRHCPAKATAGSATATDGFDSTKPLGICLAFKDGTLSAADAMRVQQLTGWSKPSDVFSRENGIRLMASIIAEVAIQQQMNFFAILEGAPFQNERALFTNDFAHSMPDTDYVLYLRLGLSYKF